MGKMKCGNCGRKIPRSAKACKYCEAPVDTTSAAEQRIVKDLIEKMDPDTQQRLREMARSADTSDEFVRQIFVGDCPKCGSDSTGDAGNDPELDNVLIGRCYDCGYYWCTECGRELDKAGPDCPCWKEPLPGVAESEGD
jgi:hypothetical protein